MARNDIHRPSAPEFDPESYSFVDCFDLFPDWQDANETKARRETVARYVDKGYKFANVQTNGCHHCGRTIRYAALMIHESTKELLYVGQQCLSNRFDSMTKAKFQELRKIAKLNVERENKKQKRIDFIAANPVVQTLIDYVDAHSTGKDAFGYEGSAFLISLYFGFKKFAELSEKQLASIEPAIARESEMIQKTAERAAAKDALINSGVQAPEGKTTVEGEVVGLKEYENDYGITYKMIVKSDAGWTVYVTIPSGINPSKGDRVRFNATLTRSQDDPLFAFGKRPTKAEVLESQVA